MGIIHKNSRCKGRMAANGYCLVCNAEAANGMSASHMAAVSQANSVQGGAKTRSGGRVFAAPPASIPAKLRAKIEKWDDERQIGNSLIVTLKKGWCWESQGVGVHVCGFDTVEEVVAALRSVASCDCPQCAA